VKHDSWNEWGEGNSIEFPIKILSNRIEIADAEHASLVEPDQVVDELESVEMALSSDEEGNEFDAAEYRA